MARKVYLFMADKRSRIEVAGSAGVCKPFSEWEFYQPILAGIQNAGNAGDTYPRYCYFKEAGLPTKWDKALNIYTVPQLLFAVGHPDYPEPATSSGTGAFSFVAKLTGDQINGDNVKLMLRVCRELVSRKRGDDIEWYNPELGWGIGVSNIDNAPGSGFIVGLNALNQEIELEGGGFKFDQFFKNLKEWLPAVAAGVAIWAATRDEK